MILSSLSLKKWEKIGSEEQFTDKELLIDFIKNNPEHTDSEDVLLDYIDNIITVLGLIMSKEDFNRIAMSRDYYKDMSNLDM